MGCEGDAGLSGLAMLLNHPCLSTKTVRLMQGRCTHFHRAAASSILSSSSTFIAAS